MVMTIIYVAGDVTSQEAIAEERRAAESLGGLTATRGMGMWLNPSTKVVETEVVMRYEVVHQVEAVDRVREFALAMKRLCKQDAVLVVTIPNTQEEVL